jgi:hypothetical protein
VSLFYPEDEGRRFLWNVNYLPDYTASHPEDSNLHNHITCMGERWMTIHDLWAQNHTLDFPQQQARVLSVTQWFSVLLVGFRMQFWTCNTVVTRLNLRGHLVGHDVL